MPLSGRNMKIEWTYQGEKQIKIRTFLKNQGVSRRLATAIRHHGGQLLLNGKDCRRINQIFPADHLVMRLPPETTTLVPSFVPINIRYEDRDLLIIEKPPRIASIPSPLHPTDSLMNRVWGYFLVRGYQKITPHIVTRLDRDTSGLVLIAKHRFAHALLNDLSVKQIKKEYLAILSGQVKTTAAIIVLPLKRDPNSLIRRQVAVSGGKFAATKLWRQQLLKNACLCRLRLYTGRTHQIRVHCAFCGHPLVGDTVYGGKLTKQLDRQGLHCCYLEFHQPFSGKLIQVHSPLPVDMAKFVKLN